MLILCTGLSKLVRYLLLSCLLCCAVGDCGGVGVGGRVFWGCVSEGGQGGEADQGGLVAE